MKKRIERNPSFMHDLINFQATKMAHSMSEFSKRCDSSCPTVGSHKCWHDPPKGGQDTGVGTLAPATRTTGSLIRTCRSKQSHEKKDWAQLQFHAWPGQFSSYKYGTPYFRILKVMRLKLPNSWLAQVSSCSDTSNNHVRLFVPGKKTLAYSLKV